jgi:hypothetical protein
MCAHLSDICRSEWTDSSRSSYQFPSPQIGEVPEKEMTENSHVTEALTKKVWVGGGSY